MNHLNLSISGMNCGHCVASVRSALDQLEGVKVERVSVGAAAVAYDPAHHTPQAIVDAVTAAGYDARIVP
jgi:copper chaperone CopZ